MLLYSECTKRDFLNFWSCFYHSELKNIMSIFYALIAAACSNLQTPRTRRSPVQWCILMCLTDQKFAFFSELISSLQQDALNFSKFTYFSLVFSPASKKEAGQHSLDGWILLFRSHAVKSPRGTDNFFKGALPFYNARKFSTYVYYTATKPNKPKNLLKLFC